MTVSFAAPGEIVDVRPLGEEPTDRKATTLIKTENVRVVRMVMAAGTEIPEHEAPGEIIVQCLEGKIEFTAMGKSQELEAGQLLYLAAEKPHAVKCVDAASVLLTILNAPIT